MPQNDAPTIPLSITINPFAIRDDLKYRLTVIYQRVAIGMNRCAEAAMEDSEIPGAVARFGWLETDRPTDEWVREDIRTWLLTSGFRDLIEGVTFFLDKLHHFFLCLEIGQRSKILGNELSAYEGRQAKFHAAGLSEKLMMLKKAGYATLPEHVQKSVESLNAARNCFVHREGRVTAKDTKGGKTLVVRWWQQRLVLTSRDGVLERGIGENVFKAEEGDKLSLRFEPAVREFELGSRVAFTTAEFSEITFTLATYFLQPVMHAVVDALRRAGCVSPEGDLINPSEAGDLSRTGSVGVAS